MSFHFRTSSAAEYSAYRDQNIRKQSLSTDLLGPVVMGPIISLDEWIPERPPKNPMLRVPSPELPPPPSPLALNNSINSLGANNAIEPHEDGADDVDDVPLPPPPPELLRHMRQKSEPDTKMNMASRRNSFAGSSTTRKPFIRSQNMEHLSPPLLPRKPNSMEFFNPRPFSSMRQPHGFQVKQAITHTQQAIKTQNILMNGRTNGTTNGTIAAKVTISPPPPPSTPQPYVNRSPPSSHADNRMRKRTHNAPLSLASPDENRNR